MADDCGCAEAHAVAVKADFAFTGTIVAGCAVVVNPLCAVLALSGLFPRSHAPAWEFIGRAIHKNTLPLPSCRRGWRLVGRRLRHP